MSKMRNPFKREKDSVVKDLKKDDEFDENERQEDVESESEAYYNDDDEIKEIESRSRKIANNANLSRPRRSPSIADSLEEPHFTVERVVRNLDKIHLPVSTTQIMNDLPTITFAKLQMLQRRRDRKIIDEKIKINLREENEEFNQETQEELDEMDDDSDLDDDFDFDSDDD